MSALRRLERLTALVRLENLGGISAAASTFRSSSSSSSSSSNDAAYAQIASDSSRSHVSWPKFLNEPLAVVDPELHDIIELEKARQWKGLELIPSENFTSASVMEVVGSILTNK